MLDLGKVTPGSTIRIPINTFSSDDPSASLAPSALVAADIEIYKDGSTTQRASDAGYVATVSFDTIVGVSLVEINLADNTTAGFFEAGSEYIVVVGPFTLDVATINAAVARFVIGYAGAILNTTIATLASQTSFTLEEGSADASAYVGCPVIVHDLASAVQIAFGYISAYAVTTRTVTLAVDPAVFTMAAGDSISIFRPSQVASWNNVPLATTNPLPNAAADAIGGLPISDAGGLDMDAMNAAAIRLTAVRAAILTDWIDGGRLDLLLDLIPTTAMRGTDGANTTTPPTAAANADAVWDEPRAGHVAAASFGQGVASVQGNVTGSVASVTAGVLVAVGGIAATAFAAGAVNAAALAQDAAREIADEILDRNLAGGGSGNTRNVRNALRAVRNRVRIVAGTATVFEEDDVTTAWTAVITTAAGDPISEVDPAGP